MIIPRVGQIYVIKKSSINTKPCQQYCNNCNRDRQGDVRTYIIMWYHQALFLERLIAMVDIAAAVMNTTAADAKR